MGDRYWVRHASSSGFLGPLSLTELRAVALPPDAQVRLAAPGGRPETLDARGWSPMHVLLGLAPPPPADPVIELPSPGAPGVRLEQVLAAVRDKSNYRSARRLASLLAVVAYLAIGIDVLAGLAEAGVAKSVLLALAELAAGGLKVAVVIVAHRGFEMLADIADCHLRRETERTARSVAPSSPGS